MLAGFNPLRRSRNIGTAKQGHGQNNHLVIPRARDIQSPLERIGRYVREEREIQAASVTFIVEETRQDSVHPCTFEDVARLLNVIPRSDWEGIRTIVFRQPTRKQSILNPVWGRLLYSGEISTPQNHKIATGPMILLDAVDESMQVNWPSSLSPDNQVELARLRADGHHIERMARTYKITVTSIAARNTQLYRTLFHEIGHWSDWLQKVREPAHRGEHFDNLVSRYFSRPLGEREAFADRYATGLRERLTARGIIPFDAP